MLGTETDNASKTRRRALLPTLARPFVRLAERYIPNPLVFAVGLTIIVAALSLIFTDTGPKELTLAWGDSMGDLLAFMSQVALTVLLGFTLAHTKPVRKVLTRLARVPRTPGQYYGGITFLTGTLSLVNWGLGLIAGALMCVSIARVARDRDQRVHYPLLVAGAYSGWVVFHMGISGGGTLMAAEPDGPFKDLPGGVVPMSASVFSTWNMVAAVGTLLAVSLVISKLAPRDEDEIIVAPDAVLQDEVSHGTDDAGVEGEEKTFADFLDTWRAVPLITGLALSSFIVFWLMENGFNIVYDIVNWAFLAIILLLVGNVKEFASILLAGGRTTVDILVQFPFYAGIIGMMTSSGLATKLTEFITESATRSTLPLLAFLAAGILNLAVPSGGGQMAIQGPLFADAAHNMGVAPETMVMAISYGDQWTNMVQPFWAIPLLAVAGLRIRQIMGYTTITLIVSGLCFTATMLYAGLVL